MRGFAVRTIDEMLGAKTLDEEDLAQAGAGRLPP